MATYTYQDFLKASDEAAFVEDAIRRHKASAEYGVAVEADLYDRQLNKTINEYLKVMFTLSGNPIEDFTASNHKIASNFFNRLNTQRCLYSLANGVSFLQPGEEGEDEVKEKLGQHFDHDVKEAAYNALIHGVSFLFWNNDRLHVFKLTEFVPLWDEHTGKLEAGIRFWRLNPDKPVTAVLYTADGYKTYVQEKSGAAFVTEDEEPQPYLVEVAYTPADESFEVVGEENYGKLPIVPMWASRLKQSTLIGMKQAIDSYDIIKSGFANDMTDCAMVYWIVENYGGMDEEDLAKFRDTLKLQHIAQADTSQNGAVKPYTQEIPHAAREAYLAELRNGLYEDFGALDVHTVAAGSTNDHIDAAYQPMDENAADFEYWVGECIQQVLAIQGIDDYPVFKRNRISNQREQVEMVVQEAQWLDQATILKKLPNVSAEEVAAILEAVDAEDDAKLLEQEEVEQEEPAEQPEG